MKNFSLLQRLLFAITGSAGKWVIALFFSTVRIVNDPEMLRFLNRNPRPKGIYAFWHSHQLPAVWHFRRTGAGILISASKDGEYIARVARSMGFRPARGSSSRHGASGFKELLAMAQERRPVAITPDGPRGPRQSISPGALALAKMSGMPVVPFAIGLADFWELPSWDRFRVPKPFSVGVGMLGSPVHVPRDADEEQLKTLAEKLRVELLALEARADTAARKRKQIIADD